MQFAVRTRHIFHFPFFDVAVHYIDDSSFKYCVGTLKRLIYHVFSCTYQTSRPVMAVIYAIHQENDNM